MTRARLVSAALAAATLAAALALWMALPLLVRAAGLQRYDLLARVLLAFAALSLADRLVAGMFPAPQGKAKDDADDL